MRWTDKDIELLQSYRESGLSISEIAKRLDRTYDSVKHALTRYSIDKPEPSNKVVKELETVTREKQAIDEVVARAKKVFSTDWKIKKSNKKSKEKPFKSYLVIADVHVPHYNKPAVRAILKLMDDVSFDGFIILGDYMDLDSISHWLLDNNKLLSLEGTRIMEDYVAGNILLDEFDKRLPENCDKRFFFGNHEARYYAFIQKYPMLEGFFHPTKELKLKERGYIVYEDLNHIEKIGKLYFTHGIYHNKHFLHKHITEFKTNVLIGHLHTVRVRLENSPAKEKAIFGASVGCLTDLNPEYNKNRPNRTAHGFAIVHFYDNGHFDFDLKRILDGKFVYNGKLYDGNE